MMPAQEPLDVIIVPYAHCPCGGHPDALVDMLIYRTAIHGIFHKIEIVCDFTGNTYDTALMFYPQG
jgi:hypothetical protein